MRGIKELPSAVKILFFLVIAAAPMIYLNYEALNQVEVTPCSPEGNPARCYSVAQNICEIVWTKSKETCDTYIQNLNLPPGRLTGPIFDYCQHAILDQAFAGSRKSTPECKQIFQDLEGWKAHNNFKVY